MTSHARLPIPGADSNVWGTVLNGFLEVEHNEDGTLKASGTLATKADCNHDHDGRYSQKGDFSINVNDHGAIADAVTLTGGSITFGSNVLACSSACFTPSDIGKTILIAGASAIDPCALRSTIAGVANATHVILTTVATSSVSGAKVVYGTDNHGAILAAWSSAQASGKELVFTSANPYLSSPLTFAGNNTRIDGLGSRLLLTLLPNDNVIGLYAYGGNLELRNLRLEVAITYDVASAGFSNYDLVRIGGQTHGTSTKRVKVLRNTFIGGAGCNVLSSENVEISGNTVSASHGNSLGAVNCKGDVVIVNNYCENGNDDLIAVTADSATGQSTTRVSVANNTVRDGDAGGIKVAGADYMSITGNHICNTYAPAIQVLQDTVYGLQPSNRVIISANTIKSGGQCFGAGRLHATMSTVANAIRINSNAADCVVVNNICTDSANRAISVTKANGLSITGNRIIGAAGAGMEIGSLTDSAFASVTDAVVKDNIVRSTRQGIILGGATNVQICGNEVRSYASGGSGALRGIVYAYLKNAVITGNLVYNDDGASVTMFESTSNSCVNLRKWGNFELADTTQMEGLNAFTVGAARIAFASAAPTAGTWSAGDVVFITAPVSGGAEGWRCTVSGTPGTWMQFGQVGAISATVEGVVKQRMRAGTWLITTGTTTGSFVPTNNRMYMTPIAIGAAVTATSLVVNVTSAGQSGSVARLGLYADDGSTTPGTRVLDAGTIATDTTGTKSITISQALSAGVYWVAAVVQNAPTLSPTVSSLSGVATGLSLTNNSLGNSAAGLLVDNVTGAMSTPCPGTGSTSPVIKVALGI